MSEPFLAEIKIFAGNFTPRGYAACDGQLMSVSQFTAVFSLVGTTYGGDGRTTFALPDLRSRAPVHPGRGPGLTSRRLGEKFGAETVTLDETQLGSHSHGAQGSENAAVETAPAGNYVARGGGRGVNSYVNSDTGKGATKALAATGGGGAHANMQPYLTTTFIFALEGIYPSRS